MDHDGVHDAPEKDQYEMIFRMDPSIVAEDKGGGAMWASGSSAQMDWLLSEEPFRRVLFMR